MDNDLDQLKKTAINSEINDNWTEANLENINKRILELDSNDIDSRTRIVKYYIVKGLEDNFSEKVNIKQPDLDQDSLQLTKLWANNIELLDDNNRKRLESARLAEMAVAIFYRNQNKTVKDVSITQIYKDSNQKDWEDFDLLVDNKIPIDVKNATYSSKNKTKRYSRYCIPRFKLSRKLNPVQIAGVLSYWSPESKEPLLFLGTTSEQYCDKLQVEFSGNLLKIDFQKDDYSYKKYLPPWIYNYPKSMYKSMYQSRDKFIKDSIKLSFFDWKSCKKSGISPIPLYLVANKSNIPIPSGLQIPAGFIPKLVSRISRMNLSLAVIYLSIIEHFVLILHSKSNLYCPNNYRPVIFPKLIDKTRPLFLYDPLCTIDGLISCLQKIWENKTEGLERFDDYKLSGHDVLIGRKGCEEKTLIAYCGDCGNVPLLFGLQKNCRVCSKLICEKCGFCSSKCKNNQKR